MTEFVRENTGAVLIVVGVVLALAIGMGAIAQIAFRENTTSTQEEVAEALVKACEEDHAFRVQYRVRAVAEQKLLDLFLDLAKADLATGTAEDPQVSRKFIREFTPLTERIEILPLPDCAEVRQQIPPP